MTKKAIKFDIKLTAVLASFIVIATVVFTVSTKNACIFEPADDNKTTNTAAATQAVSREEKQTNDLVEKMKKEGFPEKEIGDALSLAQYIENKLTNICEDRNISQAGAPEPEAINPLNESNGKVEEDLTAYKKLIEKFDVNTSVELMLRMKKDFGSIGNVMDEYLFSLQAEINLKDYIGKITEYRKVKKEKMASLLATNIITTQKIDEKLLEKLQKQNQNIAADGQTNIVGKLPQAGKRGSVSLPKVPKPGVPDQPVTDNGANSPDAVRSKAGQPNVPRPIVPGQNNGVSLPKAIPGL